MNSVTQTAITPPTSTSTNFTIQDAKDAMSALRWARRQIDIAPCDMPTWQSCYRAIALQLAQGDEDDGRKIAAVAIKEDFTDSEMPELGGAIKLDVWTYTVHCIESYVQFAAADLGLSVHGVYLDYALLSAKIKVHPEPLERVVDDQWFGIAKYLQEWHGIGNKLRWNTSVIGGCFDVWDGCKWKQDGKSETLDTIHTLLKARFEWRQKELQANLKAAEQECIAAAVANNDIDKAKAKKSMFAALVKRVGNWLDKINSPSGMKTLADQLSQISELCVEEAEYDADGLVVNLQNGLYDLRTNSFNENAAPSERLCKNVVAANFDPAATAPNWEKFILTICERTPDDESSEAIAKAKADAIETAKYLQTHLGLCLSGEIVEVCSILQGAGANGKSTLLGTLSRLLGDYAVSFDMSIVMGDTHGNTVDYQIRRLKGARLSFASEAKNGCKLDEVTLKKLSSKDPMQGRFPFERFFQFLPTHKVFLLTNPLPQIEATDRGTWRRIALVGMAHNFQVDPDCKKDSEVEAMFNAELSGILNWMISGWKRYQSEGLVLPSTVCMDTAELRQDNDLLLAWLTTTFAQDKSGKVALSDAWTIYSKHHTTDESWSEIRSEKMFVKQMKQRGFVVRKSTGNKSFIFGLAERNAKPF